MRAEGKTLVARVNRDGEKTDRFARENFSKTAIADWRARCWRQALTSSPMGSLLAAVTEAGCAHTPVKTGSGAKAAKNPRFKWVNTSGNIKAQWLATTERALKCAR